jgi:hypothetical protein
MDSTLGVAVWGHVPGLVTCRPVFLLPFFMRDEGITSAARCGIVRVGQLASGFLRSGSLLVFLPGSFDVRSALFTYGHHQSEANSKDFSGTFSKSVALTVPKKSPLRITHQPDRDCVSAPPTLPPALHPCAAAEHAVALLTAMARNVAQADASLKAGT